VNLLLHQESVKLRTRHAARRSRIAIFVAVENRFAARQNPRVLLMHRVRGTRHLPVCVISSGNAALTIAELRRGGTAGLMRA
jgi:hypothetical protein